MLDGPEDPVEMTVSLELVAEGDRSSAHHEMVDLLEALQDWLRGRRPGFRVAASQLGMAEIEDDAGG